MKATATQYAKTLYELTKDKKHQEIDGVVSDFLKELDKNGQLKIAESIAKKFRQIYNAENGIVEAEIITREKVNNDVSNRLRTYVSNKYGAKEVILNNIIDENIKGGVVIRIGDEIIDGSVSRQLSELKKELGK